MDNRDNQSVLRFLRFVEGGRLPQRADRSAGGTLPTRAFRYCEAVTTAAALGWYVFPPMGFRLLWTGTETFWTHGAAGTWYPLGAAQFPGFREHFDAAAPDAAKTYSPTFLGALPEPGIIQVWSGLIAQTKPGWSLVARAPANLPRAAGYDVFEGVVEADRWFGPLFVNIRLCRTGNPIEFDPNLPLFQVQPIQRVAYSNDILNDVVIDDFSNTTAQDWAAFHRTVVKPIETRCPVGSHAAMVRKQRQADYRGMP